MNKVENGVGFNVKKEICKVFISNSILTHQINKLMNEKKRLQEEIQMATRKIEEKKEQGEQMGNESKDMLREEKKKKLRNRRFANEIDRKYTCKYQNCGKGYGSETSLGLHIKVKHHDDLNNDDNKKTSQEDISNDLDIQNKTKNKPDAQIQQDGIEKIIGIDLNR